MLIVQVRAAHPLRTGEDESVWIAPARDGTAFYLALFNLSGEPRNVSVSAEELEQEGPVSARELWSGKDTGKTERISAELPPHDAAVFRCIPAAG